MCHTPKTNQVLTDPVGGVRSWVLGTAHIALLRYNNNPAELERHISPFYRERN